jgi:hypothetical protein
MTFASATDFNFLTFEKADGSMVSLPVSGLTLTFIDGNLVASDGTTLPLASLTKMFFTETSGISTVQSLASGPSGIYTISGIYVGEASNSLSRLPKGVYIIKSPQGVTKKIQIR